MKIFLFFRSYLLLSLFFLALSCQSDTQQRTVELSEPSVSDASTVTRSTSVVKHESVQSEQASASPKKVDADQKIIRTANLRFQVADFKESTTAINRLIQQHQAQLLTANETRTDGTLENNLVIKVLPPQFEPLLASLTEQSIYLDSKNINSEDVTTEYIDITARLKTKKAVEARYLDLLRQAKTVKDIIMVEEQLRQIREEIESSEARITYLNRQTDYNTIVLTYYQKLATTSSPDTSFAVRVRNALQGGWDFLLALLIGLLHLWPLLILVPVFVFYFRKFIRKYPPIR